MRYELSEFEWAAIKPMLPNKPRGVPRVNDRRILNGIFWVPAPTCIARAISSNGSSTRSSSVGVSPPATTNSQPTISPSSSSQLSASGYVLMSPRPKSSMLKRYCADRRAV